ncbi:hypothetical protein RIR_jg34522.t1 [Rhizophagus irregularis DAOM 181602=DAOM 197198]|nr:hypothetical protein RIR_jg34522.t1 [Rhizophagus irregularis DAOM 181602=DAOM 197198]
MVSFTTIYILYYDHQILCKSDSRALDRPTTISLRRRPVSPHKPSHVAFAVCSQGLWPVGDRIIFTHLFKNSDTIRHLKFATGEGFISLLVG